MSRFPSVRATQLDRASMLVSTHDFSLISSPSYKLTILPNSYPIDSSGDRRSQSGTGGKSRPVRIRRQVNILGAQQPRGPSSLFCFGGHVPACLPTRGSSVPAPSSRLQMKPLRNAHWCPLKHRLSPPLVQTLLDSPQNPKAIRSWVRGGEGAVVGVLRLYVWSPTNMHPLMESSHPN